MAIVAGEAPLKDTEYIAILDSNPTIFHIKRLVFEIDLNPASAGILQAIGQQLLDEMKNYFISKNCTSIRLLVLSDNKHAIAVYEKNGFMRHDLEMILKV